MPASIARRITRRCLTVADPNGHEFDFEAASPPRLYAVRWKNNRLPLDADRHREAAATLALSAFADALPA